MYVLATGVSRARGGTSPIRVNRGSITQDDEEDRMGD